MKGYRTICFAVVLAICGALQQAHLVDILGAQRAGYVLLAVALVVAALRAATTTPLGKGAKDGPENPAA